MVICGPHRYRDANPEPEDNEPPSSSAGSISNLLVTVKSNPGYTSAALALGLSTFTAVRLNQRLKSGVPLFISRSAPMLSANEPSKSYMQKCFLPGLRRADPMIVSPDRTGPEPHAGFSRVHYRSRVGSGEADYKLVTSMMRVWKHVEAADWISLHWTKDSLRDYVAIIFRCMAGYVIAPFRVHESWSDIESQSEKNSTIVSSGTHCVTTSGSFLEGTILFKVEWQQLPDGSDGGDVYFDITCDSRSAANSLVSICAGRYLGRLHEDALASMCARMVALCSSTRGLRTSRQHAFK
jgi:hypothetical protein